MTDRDDSPEGFLERWSRKKIEAEREAPDAPAEPRTTDESLPDEPACPSVPRRTSPRPPAEAAPKPEFDLASLPSLDSITAATDIRAFLAPGVPKELARAALRRAWSADPAIRDFKGLAENDWDFTDPTAMPGFGALPRGLRHQEAGGADFRRWRKAGRRPCRRAAGGRIASHRRSLSEIAASAGSDGAGIASRDKRADPATPQIRQDRPASCRSRFCAAR